MRVRSKKSRRLLRQLQDSKIIDTAIAGDQTDCDNARGQADNFMHKLLPAVNP